MKAFLANIVSRLFAILAALALALGSAQAQAAYAFSQQELDQMLAPVALYPDALLSQILMAATYPLEVQEAARWTRDHPDLSGDEAVGEVENENWDPSVKSLVAFPQVLAPMGENPQWTQALGDAFLDQQTQVMDTVQALRRRAQAAGNLRPDDRMNVVESGTSLTLQPYDSQIVYVPYYDPQVVYGSWWWPAYPPVYLRPWPGYYGRPAYVGGFYWGPPVAISPGFFFGGIDWRQRQARVVQVNTYYYSKLSTPRPTNAIPPATMTRPGPWRHDPYHRRGLAYPSVNAQQRFGAASVAPVRSAPARAAETRPDTRIETRRPDAQKPVETRPYPPAAPSAPIHIRIEGRRPDARPEAHTGAPAANLAPPANANRIEIRQEPRAPGAGTGTQALQGSGTPTEVHRQPGQAFAHPGEVRMRADGHVHPQSAQPQSNTHTDAPRALQPRVEIHPASSLARPESSTLAAPRHAEHHRQAPQASPAHSETPAAVATPRQPDAKAVARPKTGP